MNKKQIVITPGEPAGIGPDLVIMLAQQEWPIKLIVCADSNLLISRAKQLNLPLKINNYYPEKRITFSHKGELTVLNIKTYDSVIAGKLNDNNSHYVMKTLSRACDGCLNGEFDALLTGPINKDILNRNGYTFQGHTEYLARKSNVNHVVMMMSNDNLRVALATTHLPLSLVAKSITHELIYKTILIIDSNMKKIFNIKQPLIYVCGLNPHAGENGYIGREEIDTIIPVLNKLRQNGYKLIGPLPADTIFQQKYIKQADVILAMYHDQGLPVLKYKNFNNSINITLGLPFIRASVGHGTALNLAGSRKINFNSIKIALRFIIDQLYNN